jgi:hypothetical protein
MVLRDIGEIPPFPWVGGKIVKLFKEGIAIQVANVLPSFCPDRFCGRNPLMFEKVFVEKLLSP